MNKTSKVMRKHGNLNNITKYVYLLNIFKFLIAEKIFLINHSIKHIQMFAIC